jgi:hypothetical protein
MKTGTVVPTGVTPATVPARPPRRREGPSLLSIGNAALPARGRPHAPSGLGGGVPRPGEPRRRRVQAARRDDRCRGVEQCVRGSTAAHRL